MSAQRTRVAFFKLKLDQQQVGFLDALSLEVIQVRTTQKSIALLESEPPEYFVLDMGTGGRGPEEIVGRAHQLGLKTEIVGTTLTGAPAHKRRAAALKIPEIYAWPEGVIGHLTSGIQTDLGLKLRSSERVVLQQKFRRLGTDLGEGGELVNLSATGALLRLHEAPAAEKFALDFEIPGYPNVIHVTSQCVRVIEDRQGYSVALQFLDINDEQREAIRDFVHNCNVFRTSDGNRRTNARTIKAKVRIDGQKRTDYLRVEDITHDGAILIPQKADLQLPYEMGMKLRLNFSKPGVGGEIIATIKSHAPVDESRVDSPMGYRVTFEKLVEEKLKLGDVVGAVLDYRSARPKRNGHERPRRKQESSSPESASGSEDLAPPAPIAAEG